jgi:peptidoglycan/xylan/chitin deacetylase (PgdA/CDA1 family)
MTTQAVSAVEYARPADAVPRPVSPFRGGISRKLADLVVTKSVRARNKRPLVSFTFDDIPESAYVHGAPVLEKYGVRGTFYIAGGLCDTTEPTRRLMPAADCADLHRRGHEIGCHTFSHPVVQTLDAEGFTDELDRNRQFLGAHVPSLKLDNFCYPYGVGSLPRKLQAQGRFDSCRGTKAGVNAGTIDLGMLKATPIDHTTAAETIVHAIDEAIRRNGWLILFTHDVSPVPTWIGCTPEFLDAAVGTALARGCEVVTVREALQRIRAT